MKQLLPGGGRRVRGMRWRRALRPRGSSRRVPPALLTSALGLAVLAGCSADPSEFRDQAEKNIVGVLGSGARADCQEPAGTAVGITFACTGTDASGRRTTYTAEITKRDEVTVRPDR